MSHSQRQSCPLLGLFAQTQHCPLLSAAAASLAYIQHNSNKRLHFPAHVLGVCGPSPIPPGQLVLSVTIRTVDVQHAKVRQSPAYRTAEHTNVSLLPASAMSLAAVRHIMHS